jgi:hypothetical protein
LGIPTAEIGLLMKNRLKLSSIAAVTLLVSGCSAGPSAEQSCKDYLNDFGTYLAALMEMDSYAEASFATELRALADKAPQEIATAMRNDALDVANSTETATACGPYIKN